MIEKCARFPWKVHSPITRTFSRSSLRSAMDFEWLSILIEYPLSLVRDRLQMLFGCASEFRPWGLWCSDEPP
jgi:hypothetical protein